MTDYLAAFLIGMVSAGHCMGMCGGLMLAAGLNNSRLAAVLGYNIGRIVTYATLGALFGLISQSVPVSTLPFLKLLSSLLLFLTAMHLLGQTNLLRSFEKLGTPLWRFVQPYSKKLVPVRNFPSALLLGAIWGLIPCGLVYTAISFSLSSGSAFSTMIMMTFFGIGTLPAMLGTAIFSTQFRKVLTLTNVRYALAGCLFILAILIAYNAIEHLR